MILQAELVKKSPWHMLVGCILLNQTTRKQVDRAWPKIFEVWPTPEEAVQADRTKLEIVRRALHPLGLENKRLKTIRRMSVDYLMEYEHCEHDATHINVHSLYGCGKYASDSFKIFVLGENDIEEIMPTDKELIRFLNGELPESTPRKNESTGSLGDDILQGFR